MATGFLLVVDPSIKEFLGPLKGIFEVLTPEEFPERLSRAREEGLEHLIVQVFPEELLGPLRERASEFPHLKFTWAQEKPSEATRSALELLSGASEPRAIEEESFKIISSLVDLESYPRELRPIVWRLIHATGDPAFPQTLWVHPRAVKTGIELIRSGRDVLTDVEMVKRGVDERRLSRWGDRKSVV